MERPVSSCRLLAYFAYAEGSPFPVGPFRVHRRTSDTTGELTKGNTHELHPRELSLRRVFLGFFPGRERRILTVAALYTWKKRIPDCLL